MSCVVVVVVSHFCHFVAVFPGTKALVSRSLSLSFMSLFIAICVADLSVCRMNFIKLRLFCRETEHQTLQHQKEEVVAPTNITTNDRHSVRGECDMRRKSLPKIALLFFGRDIVLLVA